MITLKDIALLANVDISTVSRAFNDNSYVNAATKKQIFEAAEKLSYNPDRVKKIISNGKNKMLGVIVPYLGMSLFEKITSVIESEAKALGYSVVISLSHDNPKNEMEILQRMKYNLVDGIIIASTGKNKKIIQDINLNAFPVVQIIRTHDRTIDSFVGDYYDCARFAVEYMYFKRCKNICLIDGNLEQFPYIERHRGYINAIKKCNLKPKISKFFFPNNNYYKNAYCNVDFFLAKRKKVDAILTANDIQAMAVIRRLKELKYSVPNQIKVMSLTGNSIGDILETKISSFELSGKNIAEKATHSLIVKIEHPDKENNKPPTETVFKSTLVEREST